MISSMPANGVSVQPLSKKTKTRTARASTSTKNRRVRSPSPYRTRVDQTPTDFVNEFWQHTINTAERVNDDFKHQALPLARIKKVMKSDPEVRMISSEVTVLFEKACQIFIQELTARSHSVSLSSRRRTLSRPDVAQAISKSDMFDFLIDIVPREEGWEAEEGGPGGVAGGAISKRAKGRTKGSVENVTKRKPDSAESENRDHDDGAAEVKRYRPADFDIEQRVAVEVQGVGDSVPGFEDSITPLDQLNENDRNMLLQVQDPKGPISSVQALDSLAPNTRYVQSSASSGGLEWSSTAFGFENHVRQFESSS